MNDKKKKAIIFSPFWRQEGHVGNNRVDRFIRWFSDAGYTVVVIRAGSLDGERSESWGTEITVRDRLGLYRDQAPGQQPTASSPRKPNRLRRYLAYRLFNPDFTVLWARDAAAHPAVLKAVAGGDLILSSSPPESSHVGAWMLSRRTEIPYVIDMRDGWLDEPLRPLLQSSRLRRWREGRLESRILREAKAVQVTSTVWKELLCARYPALSPKVHVITNAYPRNQTIMRQRPMDKVDAERLLIHAGRFTGSRSTQLPALLLEPLLRNLTGQAGTGVIQLIGDLAEDELKMIAPFKSRFNNIGWRIECTGSIPRKQLLDLLPKADGLLLLCASYAALPSKLFEYIPTEIPIFVAADKNNATWKACASLPQATLREAVIDNTESKKDAQAFYMNVSHNIPSEYSETFLSQVFNRVIA